MANKGKKMSEEQKQNLSRVLTGRKRSIHYPLEANKKIGDKLRGKNKSQIHCKRISIDHKNRIWITNGLISRYITKTSVLPVGWKYGRIMKNMKNKKAS